MLFGAPAAILAPRLLLVASVVALCALGLVMVYSASSVTAYNDFGDASYYLDRQAVFVVCGAVLCVICAAAPYRLWTNIAVAACVWLVAVALLALTALVGVEALGAERSLVVAGFAIQPSEVAKVAVLIAFVALHRAWQEGLIAPQAFVGLSAVAVGVPVILIYQQPDLGTVVILLAGLLVCMVLAGIRWRVILLICALGIAYVVISCITQPYHLTRILTMLDPWLDPTGDGYQTIQSLYAFGSGGVTGVGIGLSRQKYLYLPEAHTDFIFAIIGEELGLVGTLLTVLGFAVFIWAGLCISRKAPDLAGCMLAGSLTAMIGFQALANMACVAGIAPVTGKALPFISYGGSSMVTTLCMVGIVVSVSLRSRVGIVFERRRDDLLVFDGGRRAGGGGGGRAGGAARRAEGAGRSGDGGRPRDGTVVAFPGSSSRTQSAGSRQTGTSGGSGSLRGSRRFSDDGECTGRLSSSSRRSRDGSNPRDGRRGPTR